MNRHASLKRFGGKKNGNRNVKYLFSDCKKIMAEGYDDQFMTKAFVKVRHTLFSTVLAKIKLCCSKF